LIQEDHGQTEQLEKDIIKRKRVEKQLTRSHDRLSSLSSHIETVRELERAQIAREVHDDLGQKGDG